MASAYKTDYLGLNRWIGSDKPKRDDFVQDNEKVDNAFRDHAGDEELHVNPQEREKWNTSAAQAFVTGEYTGDGYPAREIETEVNPGLVIIHPVGGLDLQIAVTNGMVSVYSATGTADGCTLGLKLEENGFTVQQGAASGNAAAKLNEQGQKYFYILFPR